jgi:hypothetical protein
MLFNSVTVPAPSLPPARGLIALGFMMLLTGCFPGAADQAQGVVVADIAEEAKDE